MKKHTVSKRILPAFLCLTMGLTGCSGKFPGPAGGGKDSGASMSPSLEQLQADMTSSDGIAGAVAYLGYRSEGDSLPLADWLAESCAGMTAEMPFLLEIPEQRVLGNGYGDCYCIIPREGNTSLTVSHVGWKSYGLGLLPVENAVLYEAEDIQPVLVYVNTEELYWQPDLQITLVTQDGLEVVWCPVSDYGYPIVSTDEYGDPLLLDLTHWEETDGSYPGDWDFPEEGWWFPPDLQTLAGSCWNCNHWSMELHPDEEAPEQPGAAALYYQAVEGEEYALAYSGIWRLEDSSLYLELSDGAGNTVSGSFPVQTDAYGEYLTIQQDPETLVSPPFFDEGVTSMELFRSFG